MKTPTLIVGILALLCGDAALLAQDRSKDVLITRTGRRIRGVEVVEMTASTVRYDRGGDTQDMSANLLAEVQWSDPPESFLVGRSALDSGQFQQAADAFGEAAGATRREVLKAEAEYLQAEALVRAAGSDQQKAAFAADKLTAWITTHPDGFRLPDATLALGKALLASGKAEEAELTFKKLADDSLARNWAPVWGARAKFAQARALLAKNDLGAARSTFRAAESAARSAAESGETTPELLTLQAEASVGVGETMIKERKFDEALSYFRDLARRAGTEAVQAAARAGEGEALYLKAKGAGDVDSLRAAQVALARANLMDTTAGETTAKAMYYSGLVLLELGPDHESSSYKQRAVDYFTTVMKNYSSTSWATLAAEAARN